MNKGSKRDVITLKKKSINLCLAFGTKTIMIIIITLDQIYGTVRIEIYVVA